MKFSNANFSAKMYLTCCMLYWCFTYVVMSNTKIHFFNTKNIIKYRYLADKPSLLRIGFSYTMILYHRFKFNTFITINYLDIYYTAGQYPLVYLFLFLILLRIKIQKIVFIVYLEKE